MQAALSGKIRKITSSNRMSTQKKPEHQEIQHVMDAADALLLGAVMGVDIRPPVGGKPRLHRPSPAGPACRRTQTIPGRWPPAPPPGKTGRPSGTAASKSPPGPAAGRRAASGGRRPGPASRRPQRPGARRTRRPGRRPGRGTRRPTATPAEARQRRRDERPHVGGEKSPAADRSGSGRRSSTASARCRRLHVVFQPQQHVDVAHQHVERGVQEQKRHQRRAALPQTRKPPPA